MKIFKIIVILSAFFCIKASESEKMDYWGVYGKNGVEYDVLTNKYGDVLYRNKIRNQSFFPSTQPVIEIIEDVNSNVNKKHQAQQNQKKENQESYFQKAYSKFANTVDQGVGKILQYPKTSAALASIAAVGTFGYYYKTNYKFRKKVKKDAEYYYYKFLEEMFYLKTKLRNFNEKKLMTSHLAYSGILYGLGYKAKKLNDENQISGKVYDFLKNKSFNTLTMVKEFISDTNNKNSLKNIGYGMLAGSFLIYLYKKVNEPVFRYQEIYNNLITSLSQEQINKIGLVNLLQTEDNPDFLKNQEIYSHLNSDQKKQVKNIIAEFENQKKNFESQV